MIEYKNTCFTYNNKTLINDFSLKIDKGDKIVLYGPSGSGKSTLIHALLGFVPIEQGEITVCGMSVTHENITKIRNSTSWLPQDISILYNTVKDMIYTPFAFRTNRSLTPTDKSILDAFDILGLEKELLSKRANEISGGQRQRILMIATTLLHKPILLLDEPTSALDKESVGRTIKYLKQLTDVSMIAVSHDETFINGFDKKVFIPKLDL